MEYHLTLKRNELSSHGKTWRNLKCVLVREGNQSENTIYSMIPTIYHSGKAKTVETVKRPVVVKG